MLKEKKPRLNKEFDEILCPHCSKKVNISLQYIYPYASEAFSDEMSEKCKEELLERVNEIEFKSEEDKESTINWIQNTMIGPEDVEIIISNILSNNSN